MTFVVVFVPPVSIAYRGRWLDGWRWVQRIARTLLMSVSLLRNRSRSSHVSLAPTLLHPGSGPPDVFPVGVHGNKKHRSCYVRHPEDKAVAARRHPAWSAAVIVDV